VSDQQLTDEQRKAAIVPRPRKPAEGWRCPTCGECDWLIASEGWPCPGCFEAPDVHGLGAGESS
jgi:hypothetical protein